MILEAKEIGKFPVILVENKTDLMTRQVSTEEGKRLAENFGFKFFRSSATKNQHVLEPFFELVSWLQHQQQKLSPPKMPRSLSTSVPKAPERMTPNRPNSGGVSRLMTAVSQGNKELVQSLLQDTSHPVNFQDLNGNTALHIACQKKHVQIARLLVQNGRIFPSTKNHKGKTPLDLALEGNSMELIIYLLDNPRVLKEYFLLLCWKGKTHDVQTQLEDKRVDPNWKTEEGKTGVDLAIQQGHFQVLKLLLEDKRTILPQNLQWVWNVASPEILAYLLDRSCLDLDIPDIEGNAPIHILCRRGFTSILQRILPYQRLSPFLAKNDQGENCLWIACEKGHSAIVEELLGRPEVLVNEKDRKGRTPLWAAASNGHERVVRVLLRSGLALSLNNPTPGCPLSSMAFSLEHDDLGALLLSFEDNPHITCSELRKTAKSPGFFFSFLFFSFLFFPPF